MNDESDPPPSSGFGRILLKIVLGILIAIGVIGVGFFLLMGFVFASCMLRH